MEAAYLLQLPLVLWIGWVLYVFTMGIYRAHLDDRLTGINKTLAIPVVAVAIILDILANITIATVVFLDLPRELLITTRLQKYMKKDTGWRKKIAKYLCDHILDPFDPRGNHC